MLRFDEILEALPSVGLALWMLDYTDDQWHAAVYDPANPIQSRGDGVGATPVAAMTLALKEAGVELTDA